MPKIFILDFFYRAAKIIMAARKRTKKYDLNDLVDNFRLVDLSEGELIDDNDSDRESYFSDSKFENDTNTIAHLQYAATANTSHNSVQSAGNTSNISTSDTTCNERGCWNCLAAMIILKLPLAPISLTTAGNL